MKHIYVVVREIPVGTLASTKAEFETILEIAFENEGAANSWAAFRQEYYFDSGAHYGVIKLDCMGIAD